MPLSPIQHQWLGRGFPFAFPCLSGAGGPGMSTLEAQGAAAWVLGPSLLSMSPPGAPAQSGISEKKQAGPPACLLQKTCWGGNVWVQIWKKDRTGVCWNQGGSGEKSGLPGNILGRGVHDQGCVCPRDPLGCSPRRSGSRWGPLRWAFSNTDFPPSCSSILMWIS